jgi:hypothetical protein
MPNVWQCFIFVEYQKTQDPNSLKWALKNVPEKMQRQKTMRISLIFPLLHLFNVLGTTFKNIF